MSLSFTADDFVYILEYCVRTPDPLFVMETFGTMRKKEVEMNNKGHLLIIQALCKGGYVEEAFSMICLLGETPDHYPDLHMYNNLLGACADMKHTDYAKKCLDLMDHAFMGKDERTYMELLKMQNLGVDPSCGTYDGFIRALVGARGFRDGIQALKLMQQKNMKPHDSTFATLSIGCSKALKLDLAEAFINQIPNSSVPYHYNTFLEACAILDQPERAVQIFSKMRQLKVKLDIRTYELLFSLFGNVNAPYEEGDTSSQIDVAKRIRAIEEDM